MTTRISSSWLKLRLSLKLFAKKKIFFASCLSCRLPGPTSHQKFPTQRHYDHQILNLWFKIVRRRSWYVFYVEKNVSEKSIDPWQLSHNNTNTPEPLCTKTQNTNQADSLVRPVSPARLAFPIMLYPLSQSLQGVCWEKKLVCLTCSSGPFIGPVHMVCSSGAFVRCVRPVRSSVLVPTLILVIFWRARSIRWHHVLMTNHVEICQKYEGISTLLNL